MRVDFEYNRNIPPTSVTVTLERDSVDSARQAVRAATETGLGVAIYSYSDILARVLAGQNPIEICAQVTGTAYNEQLKTMFAADSPLNGQSWPNAGIAVVQYTDRIDLEKVAKTLSEIHHGRRPIGKFKFMSVERLGVPRGYLGITSKPLMVPALDVASGGDSYDPVQTEIVSSQILDQSIRGLSRFCMLAGSNRADALVVIDGQNRPLEDRLDAFFGRYFEGRDFAIADIVENRTV